MKEKLEKIFRWTKGMMKTVEQNIPQKKKPVYIRLDEDIIDFFKGHGSGYQARINAVLKAYMKKHI
jgi:uncharacterized protein (DUF4415 family)